MTRKEAILKEMQKKLDWMKTNTTYNIACMYLQGSQNYGLDNYTDDYQSDFDVICFVVPTLKDLLEDTQMVSKTLEMDDKSHIDVKDIRRFPQLLYKLSIKSLELLYTPYFLVNKEYHRVDTLVLHRDLKILRDDISNRDTQRFLKTAFGVMTQKYKNLDKVGDSQLEKNGYNPKDFHHLVRVAEMINEVLRLDGKIKYDSLMSLDFLTKSKKNLIKNYKIKPIPYEDAIHIADTYMDKTKRLVDEYLTSHVQSENTEIEVKMNELFDSYIQKCVTVDIITKLKATNDKKRKGKEQTSK